MKTLGYISVLVCILITSAQAKFENISDLTGNWANLAQTTKNSIVKFDIIGSGRCTGTIISDEGHVLTAMHCFHGCLKSSRSFKVHKVENELRTDFFVTVDQTKLPTCNMRYKKYSFEDNDDLQSEIIYADAKLVATGKGKILLNPANPDIDSIMDFHQSNEDAFNELRKYGVGRIIGDYAIFKSKAFAKKKCVKLNPAKEAKELLSLSFPTYTWGRETGVNPNGRSMYASLGKISDDGLLKSSSAFVDELKANYTQDEINKAYTFEEDIIWSDNDILGGASGSMTFNENGVPYSLVTYNICDGKASRNEGCSFSSGSIKLSRVLSDLSSTHSKEKISAMTSCQ